MRREIALSRIALSQIETLLQLVPELDHIERAIRQMAPSASPSILAEKAAQELNLHANSVMSAVTAVANFARVKLQNVMTVAEVINMFDRAIKRDATSAWMKNNREKWKDAVSHISAVLEVITADHPLIISQKAEELAFSHQNVIRDTNIVTDVRPVFDDSALKIV